MPLHRTDEARLTVITRTYVVASPLTNGAARSHRLQVAPRAIANQSAVTQQAAADCGNLCKGFAWALALEGAAALTIYAVWRFWHVLQLHF